MRVSLLGTGGIGGTLRDLLAAGRVAGCVTGAAVGSRFPAGAVVAELTGIAVTLGLATTGIDRVRVVVTADPAARRTRHEITARTAVGEYRFALVNDTLAASRGRTSAITVWSVVRALEELAARGRTPIPLKKGAPS
ncbi:aspartate dehydrogenase domain-containing protein [Acrocarpospora sp. B8E8]|uniref:aspartate dehydrogenase domain-containing protein n=1 Tax=Acrocarpospora sp. B8E8 TaxID=3153572 RepID=UPI00325D7478